MNRTAIKPIEKGRLSAKIYRDGLVVEYLKNNGRSREECIRIGRLKKHYSMKRSAVISASINLWRRRQGLVLFPCYTFPFEPTEKEANRIFINHLKNLIRHYDLLTYVWVKENQKSGRIHFHLLMNFKCRPDIKKIQESYNNSILNVRPDIEVSNNSVRLGNNPVVKNITQVSRYIAKYITKDEKRFDERCYGYSKGISDVCIDVKLKDLDRLVDRFGRVFIYSDSFITVYYIKSYVQYCDLLKYPP